MTNPLKDLLAVHGQAEKMRKALDDIANGMIPGHLLNPWLDEFGKTGDEVAFRKKWVTWMQETARKALE